MANLSDPVDLTVNQTKERSINTVRQMDRKSKLLLK